MNFFKIIFYLLAYGLPIAIGSNFVLGYNLQKRNPKDDFIFKKLNSVSYFQYEFDPYKAAHNLEVHPTNYFSLPINSKSKKSINNLVFSLNKNGYRKNPNLPTNKKNKKCILFLGSSAGFGIGSSSNKKTIPAIINSKLGPDYYIYNLSIPSWNSRQELISIINFFNHEDFSHCNKVDSISFTGTTDIDSIKANFKSTLFLDKDSRFELISAPENFQILLNNVKAGISSENSLKYNFKKIFIQSSNFLFGNLYKTISNIYNDSLKKEKIIKASYLKPEQKTFISKQIDSFLINQKIISQIINSIGGNHLVVLQPHLNNSDKSNEVWTYINTNLSKKVLTPKCLNILDLRETLNIYQPKIILEKSNQIKYLSLKESIKENIFEEKDLNKYQFYDNAHLTDSGSSLVATFIIDSYKDLNNNKEKCQIATIYTKK